MSDKEKFELITANLDSEFKKAKEGNIGPVKYANSISAANRNYIYKEANAGSSGYMGGQVVRVNSKPFSPIYNESYLMMPRDRRELNAWCRHYYVTDPIIRNGLDLHTRYPLSKFSIRCPHKKQREFFEDMSYKMNLYQSVLEVGLEYWMIGEVFAEGEMDPDNGIWRHIVIHNPDYIDVRRSNLVREPFISLIPDDELRRICTSNDPRDAEVRNQLDPEIIGYIVRGLNIPLDNIRVSHICNKVSPYNVRGTSLLECLFKDLMLRDKYREAQYVIADTHVTPLKIFKVGDEKFRPNEGDLLAFRDLLEEATYDPNFVLVYHSALEVEYVGSQGAILDLTAEYERIERMMFTGLFLNADISQSNGPGFQNDGSVALDLLTQRYVAFRQQIAHWIERKIFEPISRIQEFYEYKDGEKKLIVPSVGWQRIGLKNTTSHVDALMGLATDRKISYHTLYTVLDLDFEEETRMVREEEQLFKRMEMTAPEGGEAGGENILADLDSGPLQLGGESGIGESPEPTSPEPSAAPEPAGE